MVLTTSLELFIQECKKLSSERQAPSFPNNISPCSIIQFNRVIKNAITVNHVHLNRKLKTIEISHYGKEI